MAHVLYSFYQQLEIEQKWQIIQNQNSLQVIPLRKFPYRDKPLKYCETN